MTISGLEGAAGGERDDRRKFQVIDHYLRRIEERLTFLEEDGGTAGIFPKHGRITLFADGVATTING